MKKLITFFLVFALLVGISVNYKTVFAAGKVSLNATKKTIYVGNAYELKLNNANGSVKWSSDNTSVATVLSSGVVVALSKGKATITAKNGGTSYTCAVTVKNPSLSSRSENLYIDRFIRLKMRGSNVTSWESSNPSVARVDDGGLVTAVSKGQASIKAKCENGKTYTCKINVKGYRFTIGQTVYFGKYEQDYNEYNGKDDIAWEVLDIKDGKALLLCKNMLEFLPYNTTLGENIYWENCYLRSWLNKDFYDEAFSTKEKNSICESTITTPTHITSSGPAAIDKVFVLSRDEVEEYFKNLWDLKREATSYAKRNNIYTTYSWTRTKWYDSAYVGGDDWPQEINEKLGVCPAMWIILE